MPAQQVSPRVLDLPTSKQLALPVPGNPQKINSLPMALAVSPDGRWIVSLNGGYGTHESGYRESLAVLDTSTGEVRDFPDGRTDLSSKQTLYSGLTFSADGRSVYAAMASESDPAGNGAEKTGNAVAVYGFADGRLTPGRLLRLEPTDAPAQSADAVPTTRPNHYPAALALVPNREHETLLVAENLSDTVSLVDTQTGGVLRRIDVGIAGVRPPASYPIALAVTRDGRRAFVALWNASTVAELDLEHGTVVRRIALMKPPTATAAGSHPCALVLDEARQTLYVALANRDAVAVVNVGGKGLGVRGYFNTRLPGQTFFGAEPDALALSSDGARLYAANLGSDAVAVLDTAAARSGRARKDMLPARGFVPTELMPTAIAFAGGKVYVATDKGQGIGPNNMPQVITPEVRHRPGFARAYTYGPTLLYGSLAVLDAQAVERDLQASTEAVLESNRMKAAAEPLPFAAGHNPIRHVIYIIKENRTYDQVLGDLSANGRPVGNGDPRMTMYGAAITPNLHKLALQFGVLDNFYDSGEVSGSGHTWSMAAIGTEYLEKTWQQSYRSSQRTYDFEGMVAAGIPLLQGIPDVNEPASGYLWSNFAAHGKTVYHFGEYIASTFCGDKPAAGAFSDPKQGAMAMQVACASPGYKPGEALPDEWGGGKNIWPWAIPKLVKNTATKPELRDHFAAEMPDFNLRIPDQVRVNVFIRHLEQWKRDRAAGHDTMPEYIMLRLPNDHTGGTTPGGPTPSASIADNDLAVGRAVEAISHSAFWDDTAFFILEDDAQNGGDHVDAHRSIGLVISKYSPHAPQGKAAFVDSRFYTTVSMVRTMETLLGVPPMNNNDALCSMMSPLFAGPGDQPAFVADASNRENGLIFRANKPNAPGAAESLKMDFRHADRADALKLNRVLWMDAKGTEPPAGLFLRGPKHKDADDEE